MNKKELKEVYANHKIGNLQMNIYTNKGYVPYHWHDEYEFIRIISGNCECIINGKSIQLSADEAILIHNHELHTIAPKSTESKLDFFSVVVHPYVIFGTDCNQFYDLNIRFQRIYKDKKTLSLLDNIYNAYVQKHYGYEMLLKSCIISIFSELYSSGKFTLKAKKYNKEIDLFSDIIHYIHDHYNEKISLDDLRKISYCSSSYLIQIFKINTGKTPIEYINCYRIYQSTKLLKSSKKTVLEISLNCGFENVGYFIKIFKRQIGITPHQYRKQSNGV